MSHLRYGTACLLTGSLLLAAPTAFAVDAATTVAATEAVPARVELTIDGYVLVTPEGMTLYWSQTDGRSQCLDTPLLTTNDQQSGMGERPILGAEFQKSCIDKFPRYLAGTDSTPVDGFSLVDTPQGKQWAWEGRPLHLSIKDRQPGDRYGVLASSGPGGVAAIRLARLPANLPGGITLVTRDEGLVLADANGRPLYTPEPGIQLASVRVDRRFSPVQAPAIANVSGDMAIVNLADGLKQYAFREQPLYEAPTELSEAEVARVGGWRQVVFHPGEGRPAEIRTHITLNGEVYTTSEGLSLYIYTCNTNGVPCDDPGDAAANWTALCGSGEECARRWRPYLAKEDSTPQGNWSIVEVAYPLFTDPQGITYPPEAPRVKAWAYLGRPVYTYHEDKKPGDVWGDWMWGLWGGGRISSLGVPGRGLVE